MANVCISCGLTTDAQGSLTIDAAPWPFRCAPDESRFAMPVGCGADGRLYAPPRQVVMTDLYTSANAPGLNYSAPPGTNANGWSRTFELELNNPDPCRRMHGIAIIEIDVRVNLAPGAEFRADAIGNQAQRIRNDSAATRQPFNEFTRSLQVSIPPGATQTLSWIVGTAAYPTQGGGQLVGVLQTVRVMAVSSQPA